MEGLTKKQKEFADEYLATGKFPDGIKRSCFNKIVAFLRRDKNINITTNQKDVYFIRCTETKRIKIGISNNVACRLIDLNRMSPTKLELVLTVEWGGEELEKHLHRKFARCRYKGEWFNPDKEMLLMIDDIIKIQKNAN